LNGFAFEDEYFNRNKFEGVSFDFDDIFYVVSLEEAQNIIICALEFLEGFLINENEEVRPNFGDGSVLYALLKNSDFLCEDKNPKLEQINKIVPEGVQVTNIIEDRIYVLACNNNDSKHPLKIIIPVKVVDLLTDVDKFMEVAEEYGNIDKYGDGYYQKNRRC
jgi:hypothetical protein